MFLPSKVILPDVASKSPFICCIRVDFPEPVAPITPINSSSLTFRFMSERAFTPIAVPDSYVYSTFSNSKIMPLSAVTLYCLTVNYTNKN